MFKYEDQLIILKKKKKNKTIPCIRTCSCCLSLGERIYMNLRRWYRAEFDTFPAEDFIYFG